MMLPMPLVQDPDSPAGPEGGETIFRPGVRPNGALIISLVVVGGLLGGAGFYRYAQPRVQAEVERRLEEAPRSLAGRVELWTEYGAISIHQRLTTARFARTNPWLVTHRVERGDGEPPEVWGLVLDALDPAVTTRAEDGRVIVRLPEPELLGRVALEGHNAAGVPTFGADEAPEPREALREKVEWLLEALAEALSADIEGAELVVRVGDTADASPN